LTQFYFAYGSNMSSARLHARITGAEALGPARLLDFELVFDKPGRDGSAKANLRAAPNACAHGVLWRVESIALDTLDDFEPGYERILQAIVPAAATATHAWTYIHPGSSRPMQPSHAYLSHLVVGVREHGLPDELLTRLERLAAALG